MNEQEIILVVKTPGRKIAYEVQKNKLIFGDDELAVNLASRERDYEVTLDICIDTEDGIVIGTGGKAQKYAAEIIIPARRYEILESNIDDEMQQTPIPIAFDMKLCTLILWGLEE